MKYDIDKNLAEALGPQAAPSPSVWDQIADLSERVKRHEDQLLDRRPEPSPALTETEKRLDLEYKLRERKAAQDLEEAKLKVERGESRAPEPKREYVHPQSFSLLRPGINEGQTWKNEPAAAPPSEPPS